MASVLENYLPSFRLAELHAHLGSSIEPATLWYIAHNLGLKLPTREYADFESHVRLSATRRMTLDTYLKTIYHPLLDKLSSGTQAVEEATYRTLSNAYRQRGIGLIELRNNPMRHNRNAEYDLDHVIMAMLRGMERALLECQSLSAGLIFCMAREFDFEQNSVIVEKAIKYHNRGVVGIDIAGSATAGFILKDHAPLIRKARAAGLKVTVHSGELAEADDLWEALEYIAPDRIGHGVRAAYDPPLMKELVRRGTVLEVCPMSNLATKAVENEDELRFILRTFLEYKVPFCINTDWPEVIEECRLQTQYAMLRAKHILSDDELHYSNRIAWASSFIPKPGGLAAYL